MAAAAVIQQALSVATGLWHSHVIRATDAKNENDAVAQVIPQWDRYFVAIIQAYNAGEATRDQALSGLQSMDQQTQQELHQFVGKPGTSWDSKPPQRCGDGYAAICDKTCTVGCCVYKAYLSRPTDCAMQAIASGKGRSVTRGTIQGSKYGLPTFPSYTVQIADSSAINPIQQAGDTFTSLIGALGVGGGNGQTQIGSGYGQPESVFQSALGGGGGSSQRDYTKLLLYGAGIVLLLLLLMSGRESR